MDESNLKLGQRVYLPYLWDDDGKWATEDFTYGGKTSEGYKFLYRGRKWDDATVLPDLSNVFLSRADAKKAAEKLNRNIN